MLLQALLAAATAADNKPRKSETAPFQPAPMKAAAGDVPLYKDLGGMSFKLANAGPKVQAYFDQGLRFYMGFNNRESYRAFRYASQLAEAKGHPCAWCEWGAAVPLGTDINMTHWLKPDRDAANAETGDQARYVDADIV